MASIRKALGTLEVNVNQGTTCEEGKAEGILETARNLKAIGISFLDIAKATGLSYDEIERL